MATLQLLARCRTSGSGSSLNSAKIPIAALGARTVLYCLLILKLFSPFQLTCEKRPLLERSIPSRCLLCIAQSSFQQQSTPNVVFLTRGFYLGRFDTALHAHIIPNILPFAHYKRRRQRDRFAAFGDSAECRTERHAATRFVGCAVRHVARRGGVFTDEALRCVSPRRRRERRRRERE